MIVVGKRSSIYEMDMTDDNYDLILCLQSYDESKAIAI